ncbi:site-specific DNA-methyltransferase [Diaphorobacter sp.]|uniref:site-specific DNA-methyltransferase n=1 Tax=Diaphorobacter sp. TaxID=1934310 RepID=UPI0025897D86|nr:site-specific DNA-methyltransferase [Diaphorobacter sp.]
MPTLDWLNRSTAFTTAAQVPYRLLDTVSTHGDAASAQGNLLIQGDNLEALKALLPFYRGKVKCIFIDPPYNTQSAFEHYDDNLEHSQWLSMMLPRLQLLRELLAEDGSIWVTIDDHEGHYLKVLMDEVFGRRNFVATFVWQKVDSPNDNKPAITPDHEFLLSYARNAKETVFQKKKAESLVEAYGIVDEQGRRCRDRLLKKNGKNSLRSDRPSMYFRLDAPDGTPVWPVHDDGREARWSHSQRGIDEARNEGRLIWKQRERNGLAIWIPYIREFAPATPVRPHPTILLDVKTSRQAKAHQRELLPDAEQFDTVKPEQLLERVFEIATNPGDLVLDSFLGSGTTAAVAHKMGRRWIGIEMGEHAATHCLPRLEKVVAGEQGGISQAVGWQGGGGFRFARLGAPVFDAQGCIHPEVRFATLAAFVWQQETGTAFDSANGQAGTPWLGTHSVFDSFSRLPDAPEAAIPPETEPPELVLRSRTAYYLLFNGILGDKRPASGNVLTRAVLDALLQLHAATPHPEAPLVVYGEANRLGPETLARARVTFKHIPYDVKAR